MFRGCNGFLLLPGVQPGNIHITSACLHEAWFRGRCADGGRLWIPRREMTSADRESRTLKLTKSFWPNSQNSKSLFPHDTARVTQNLAAMRRIQLTSQMQRRLFSSSALRSSTVPLAFTRHDPPSSSSGTSGSPILLLHGLFGSQRNNRSMSKYAATYYRLLCSLF